MSLLPIPLLQRPLVEKCQNIKKRVVFKALLVLEFWGLAFNIIFQLYGRFFELIILLEMFLQDGLGTIQILRNQDFVLFGPHPATL